jgi:hypothetical protein
MIQELVERSFEKCQIDRFDQVGRKSGGKRPLAILLLAQPGKGDQRDLFAVGASSNLAGRFHAVHLRHAQV